MEAYVKIKFEEHDHVKHEMSVILSRLILHKKYIVCADETKNITIHYVEIIGSEYNGSILTYTITEESYNEIEEFLQKFKSDSM